MIFGLISDFAIWQVPNEISYLVYVGLAAFTDKLIEFFFSQVVVFRTLHFSVGYLCRGCLLSEAQVYPYLIFFSLYSQRLGKFLVIV